MPEPSTEELRERHEDDELNLAVEQAKKCLDIMDDAINLLRFARPTLTVDPMLQVIAAQYRHATAGDTAVHELGPFADEIIGKTPGPDDEEA